MKERAGEPPTPAREVRSDNRKKTTFRFPAEDHHIYNELDVLQFKHKCSFNSMFYLMIRFALDSDHFKNVVLEEMFPRDTSRGFYTYQPDEQENPLPPHAFRR